MEKRNYRIKELRLLKKWPLQKIADEYGLTLERVRQIVIDDTEEIRQDIEKRYTNKFEKYISYNELIKMIEELAKPDRTKGTVIKRRILIKFLVDDLKLSFWQVGLLLDRDHTTIMHAYHGK